MKRPSTWCSSAWPRPVPAAISAMLPPVVASPCCKVCSSCGSQDRARRRPSPADRSAAPRAGCRRPRAAAASSTRHGTLVSWARLAEHRTGDAEAGRVDVARRHLRRRRRTRGSCRRRPANSSVVNVRTTSGRGRAGADSKSPRRVWCRRYRLQESCVAHFAIDFAFILLHLEAPSDSRLLSSGGRVSAASPTSAVPRSSPDRSSSSPES